MYIIVTYLVDKELYYDPATKHQSLLITTEYKHRNDVLVHLQLGRNLGVRLNNLLSYDFKKDTSFSNDQFLYRKFYSKNKAKPITCGTFEDKLKRLDVDQTVVEREILEEYSYTDKSNRSDEVQIVITVKSDIMTAVIEFKDGEQHENFICPAWLVKLQDH